MLNVKKWTCQVCGMEMPNFYLYCINCGTKRKDAAGWTCEACGKRVLNEDYNYCIYCGKKREKRELLNYFNKANKVLAFREVERSILQFINQYRILEKIGSGELSDVYKAETPQGKIVALKIPKIKLDFTSSAMFFASFHREASLWIRLRHPNIVQVHGYGSHPVPWIVMEYMEGGSLMGKLKKGPLDLKVALKISVQLADALQYAHSRGVVHQDINPKNILFTRGGVPKISDFGLSRALINKTPKQKFFEGTLISAAPEQLAPERFGKVDLRTDIYSFGATLYWMLAGKPPFYKTDTLEHINSILEEEPAPLHTFNSEIPRELDRILNKALAKKKEDRYEAVAIIKNQLQKLL